MTTWGSAFLSDDHHHRPTLTTGMFDSRHARAGNQHNRPLPPRSTTTRPGRKSAPAAPRSVPTTTPLNDATPPSRRSAQPTATNTTRHHHTQRRHAQAGNQRLLLHGASRRPRRSTTPRPRAGNQHNRQPPTPRSTTTCPGRRSAHPTTTNRLLTASDVIGAGLGRERQAKLSSVQLSGQATYDTKSFWCWLLGFWCWQRRHQAADGPCSQLSLRLL